ncbi:NuA4 histone acetyltransferase subunit [Entomophthora muscae]|uniref:NuA4 histone acetyltransferase subunit n=1 Tax=Entomophthora muscae TaxID=34485 RepID=A0ACC2S237_9FUNG|nr:NuA4 histone acetyltransferase subunit [Entomophthora muscae]
MEHYFDEISAVVLDVGSNTTRIGYAGEDAPRAMISSYMGFRGESAVLQGDSSERERVSLLEDCLIL